MEHRFTKIISLTLSILLYACLALGQDLHLCGIENSINHEIGSEILKRAYGSLNIATITKAYPAKRSLFLSNAGECDGEVQRIDTMTETYPNLIKVSEPLFFLKSSAFVKDPEIYLESWKSLERYLIGVPQGIVYLEKMTSGMNRIFVQDFSKLFRLLDLGRIDIVVISTNYGEDFLRRHPELEIHRLESPVLETPLFHYLNRKHASIEPLIASAIRNMKKEGQIDEIIKDIAE